MDSTEPSSAYEKTKNIPTLSSRMIVKFSTFNSLRHVSIEGWALHLINIDLYMSLQVVLCSSLRGNKVLIVVCIYPLTISINFSY